MIPKKHFYLLTVCLTLVLLVACEPLAPDDQTPRYVVITDEAALPAIPPSPTQLLNELSPVADEADTVPTAELGEAVAQAPITADITASPATTVANADGVVNTPVPTPTPISPPTALPSPTPFVCQEREGQLIQSAFYSTVAATEVNYQLYLPPCFYDTFRRYPYVILLHGTGYTDTMWPDLGVVDAMNQGITKGTLPPMVLIMPDGGLLAEYNDLTDGDSWEAVILQELIPTVEDGFCLWGERQGRAIGGISRGGFWAFSIALRHPEMFSILGGHSPHFEPDNAVPEYNPLDLAQSVYLEKYPLRIYLDNGASDYVGTFAIQMSEILRERGIDHQYLINPTGDHTVEYWSLHVPEYLSFYGQTWPRDPDALPSCLDVLPG